ncbi:uncharacterized protein LOC112687563 [Sipha flava]|uniref:Uncharacterized protein LOC112687563 n=1 Tax=Sipha flava TaxID=143950 RepID=A0A2S2Q6L0_9HEMI|nr:uncharacterized protein LOC112687563 [Sipha flava]
MIRCQIYTTIVIAFGYFILLPNYCEAINCWVCSTDTDQRCNDPMNMTKSAIEDCSRAPHSAFLQPVCKKQKQRVNGELMIIRSCAWASDSRSDDGPCAINTPANIRIEHCSTCDQDLCNGATSHVGSTLFRTAILATVAKLASNAFRN